MRVFLSHSTRDRAFVEQLAARMRATGFEPWLCETSIEPASNWVEEIDKGLKASDLVLLVWSPDAAKSYATKLEWTSALAREIAVQRLRLGVVLLRDCDLPELLLTRQYIDARRDSEQAITAVLAWLSGRRDLGRLAGDRAPVILEEYPTDEFFVGRATYLAALRAAFSQQSPTSFLLHGEPGTGKSTLALRFVWQAQKDFDAVIFQRCGQRPLDAITAELADKLPIDVKTRPPDEQRKAATAWLRARQSLLVLDDVWLNEKAVADFKELEPGAPCSVLYTSRLKSLPWIHGSHTSEVVSFSGEECEALFHVTLDSDFGRDEVTRQCPALLDFAKRVERLPIAVAVGANLLRQKTASPLDRGALRLRMEQLTDGVRDVPELFRKAIASQPERERRLLAAGAVCVQEGFWLPLAAQIAELSEGEADDEASRLVHASLLRVLDVERRRFQLHALLREEVRAEQSSDALGKLQEQHAAALEKLFKDWETRWRECRECLEEIIPAADFVWKRGETSREDWLTYWGYALGQRTGELETALRILKQEESFWTGRNDRAAKDALQRSYGNQALILKAWGRLEEALALHKKGEAICLELGNKDDLQRTYGNQALILIQQGRLNDAAVLLQKKEAICIDLGLKDHLGYGYWYVGWLAGRQDDRKTEKQKLEQALAIFTELKMPRERDAVQKELNKLAGG